MRELLRHKDLIKKKDRTSWFSYGNRMREKYPLIPREYWEQKEYVNTYCLLDTISKYMTKDDVYVSGSLSRYYDDKTLQNDLKVREMFTSLFENSELRDLAFRCKSAAIYTRAFVLGGKLYSSKEFKQNFAEYYCYVRSSGVYRLLYFMSRYGMYKVAYNVFELLFNVKQVKKKYSI